MQYLIKNTDASVTILTTVEKRVLRPVTNVEGGWLLDSNGERQYDDLGIQELSSCEQCLAKWHPTNLAKVESNRPIALEEIPSDRYFRAAWSHSSDRLVVDMVKCLPIHQEKLRELRKPKLEELDVAYMRALENNDSVKQQTITEKKQLLRDVTEHSDVLSATTPEQLKAAVPDILNEQYDF